MKKALSLVLSLMMILTALTALPFTAHAYKGQYKYVQDSTLGGNTFYYNLDGTEATITDFEALSAGVTDKNITIPTMMNGNTVVQIGEEVFQENDSIESVTIPATVKTINNYAFNLCFGLTSVTFEGDSQLITIGNAAFGSTAISSITLPSKVQYIAENAFEYCENLTSVTIPNSTKTIFGGAFAYCTKLSTVTIGSKVSDIKSGAFTGCSALTSISVNSSNETYSSVSGVLYNKDKTTLILYPQGKTNTGFELRDETTTIADYAFEGNTALQQLLINYESALTTIGVGAFRGCSGLNSIMDIPDSLTSIGDEAFKGVANNLYVKSACDKAIVGTKIIQGVSTRSWDMDHSGKGNYTVKENVVPATCTENGTYDLVTKCSGCDTELDRVSKTEDAKGHTPAEAVKENEIAATYTAAGSYESVVYCSVCGAELSRETVAVSKLEQKANTLKVKGKKPALKYSKLKKKSQTIARKKAMTVSKAKGTVTYKLSSAKKGKKSVKKYFKVNKKTGKITVKKGLKKGTYRVKIKVKAAGTTAYKAMTKTVTVTIKVK